MIRYTADLADRAAYRKALDRVSASGSTRDFLAFLRRHEYLFAPEEWTRLLKMLDLLGSNLPRLTHQKFLAYRGRPHDPQIDGDEYPTIIEVIITPHAFLKHALLETR